MKRIAVYLIFFTALVFFLVPPIQAAPSVNGVQIFPSDNVWNVPVNTLPVLSHSQDFIQVEGGASTKLRAAFGYAFYPISNSEGVYKSIAASYHVPAGQWFFPKQTMQVTNGRPDGTCNADQYDCSVVVLNTDTGISYDYAYLDGSHTSDGSVKVGSAGVWSLSDNSLDYSKHGSVTAAVASHLAGQVRYEEIQAGVIPHAIQIAVPYTRYGGSPAWPAQIVNSRYTSMTGDGVPRMGERFRLKASFDASGYSRTNQIIIQAMKTYGLIVTDSGDMHQFEMRGFRDSRWSEADIEQISNIDITNLEAVDESSLMISPTSGQARTSAGPVVQTPTIAVTSPNGGENWIRGTTPTITWRSTGTVGANVKIELLKAGTIVQTLSPLTANDGSFTSWTIPANLATGTDYRIQVTSATNSAIRDTSAGTFTISPQPVAVTPTITITSPNGGENWIRGATPTITWTTAGTVGSSVKIDLLKSGILVQTISAITTNDGSFKDWTIPATLATGTDYQVRISSAANAAIFDTSARTFTISPQPVTVTPTITVISPNGGENWIRGTTPAIRWTSAGSVGSAVKIDLLKAGTLVQVISASTANDGSFAEWAIPANLVAANDYRIRITSAANSAVTDMSNANFVISIPPLMAPQATITVTSPNGGETLTRGVSQTIKWFYTSNPGPLVKIVLLKNGVEVTTIASNVPVGANGIGSYSWPMPLSGDAGTDFKIRIESMSQPAINDVSNSNLAVISKQTSASPSITVSSPNGGEYWVRGTTQTISWNYSGNPGSMVKIVLLKSGVEVGTIANNVAIGSNGSGSYPWALSTRGMEGSDFKIKIQSISQASVFDMSNNVFTATYNSR